MPLVSVLIPTYNAATTLEKAVSSVLNQTEQNFEIIIIDDCSTDSTPHVIQSISSQTPKIQHYQLSENQGRSGALNLGIEKAAGKWIAVLDADDWYAPERLESLLRIVENSSVTMVADNQIFIDSAAQKQAGMAFLCKGRIRNFSLKEFLKGANALSSFDYGMLKPIILADFVRKKSISYYTPARNGQDFYYLLSFFAAGGTALITDDAYYYYTQPFGSISHSNRQHERSHYNFELIKKVNTHFIQIYKDQFSERDLNFLLKRGRSLDALISFHRIRSHLRNRTFKLLFKEWYPVNLEFFNLLANRLIKRAFIKRDRVRSFLND